MTKRPIDTVRHKYKKKNEIEKRYFSSSPRKCQVKSHRMRKGVPSLELINHTFVSDGKVDHWGLSCIPRKPRGSLVQI